MNLKDVVALDEIVAFVPDGSFYFIVTAKGAVYRMWFRRENPKDEGKWLFYEIDTLMLDPSKPVAGQV